MRKQIYGTEEIVDYVKCLLWKHEDLRAQIHIIHTKSWAWWHVLVMLTLGEGVGGQLETGEPL